MHAETESEKRYIIFSGVFDCPDLPFNSSLSKSTWNKDAIESLKRFPNQFLGIQTLGIDPFDIDLAPANDSRMLERFSDARISIPEIDILSDNSNGYFFRTCSISCGKPVLFRSRY